MRKTETLLLSILILFSLSTCISTETRHNSDHRIHVTILHFNDVYEIRPVSGGKEGGLARVATLRQQLLAKNPNTITTLGGDFFNPSAIGLATHQGERLAGRQMVDMLNHLGLDYATFGNHEFDLKEQQFYQRMKEIQFTWISSNVFDASGKPYSDVKQNLVIPFTDAKSGKTFRIGILGLTLDANKSGYVSYSDPFEAAGKQLVQLEDKSDFQIALTHQAINDDVHLIETHPQIDLLLGGHEHINYQRWRGSNTPILKGDSNVRSVYIIDLYFDPDSGKTEVKPTFMPITDSLAEEPTLKKVADKWVKIAFEAFHKEGLNPDEVVTTITKPLNGLTVSVRKEQTNLTQLLAQALLHTYPTAELSLYNSGIIRVDDILPPGEITVYDIIRILQFSDDIQLVEIKGSLLKKVLDQGLANATTGGYLQSGNTEFRNGNWFIKATLLNENQSYKVAINSFLTSGRERNLEYLTPDNPGLSILNAGTEFDIRKQLIKELKAAN